MWPLALATLGAGAISALGQHSANRANKASAKEQMAFQERMSSTAHQRQVQDLRSAGINPMLSAKLGGASTPSGASYSANNEMDAVPAAVSSAVQLKLLRSQVDNMRAQTDVAHASAARIRAETEMLPAQRARQIATQPFYDAAGTLVKGGVSTAKEIQSKGVMNWLKSDPLGLSIDKLYDFLHPNFGK